jgi:hypothetical protein
LNHLFIQSKIAIIVTEINGFSIFRLLGMRMISHLKSTFQQLHECNWFSFSFGEPTQDLLVAAQNAIDFFMQFANAKCERIAIENPIGIMSTQYKKPSQIIHPWQFGHEASKATCLWLKGLPLLKPTNIVSKGEFFEWVDAKTGKVKRQAAWDMEALKLPRAERAKVRSKTFQGIAEAMALQWGDFNGH